MRIGATISYTSYLGAFLSDLTHRSRYLHPVHASRQSGCHDTTAIINPSSLKTFDITQPLNISVRIPHRYLIETAVPSSRLRRILLKYNRCCALYAHMSVSGEHWMSLSHCDANPRLTDDYIAQERASTQHLRTSCSLLGQSNDCIQRSCVKRHCRYVRRFLIFITC